MFMLKVYKVLSKNATSRFFVHLLRAQLSNQYLKNSFSSNLTGESGKENSFFEVYKASNMGAQDGARTNNFELKKNFDEKIKKKIAQIFSKKSVSCFLRVCRAR